MRKLLTVCLKLRLFTLNETEDRRGKPNEDYDREISPHS
jgi:hypothetical protein